MKIFRPWIINEQRMIAIPLEDHLPQGHMAVWVRDIVFALMRKDLLNWREGSEGGRPAYNPAMMMAVLIFAYMRGIRSSRRIQRLLIENIAFMVLSGEQNPNFRTLSEFRRAHHALLQRVFTKVVLLALQLGMIDLGAVLVDGTLMQANASKKHSRRLKSLKKLEQEELEDRKAQAVDGLVQRMIEEAETSDAEEDRLYGREGYPDPIFADRETSSPDRLERIQKAIRLVEAAELKRRQRLAVRRAKLFRLAWKNRRRPARGWRRTKRKGRRVKIKGLSEALSRLSAVKVPRQRRGNVTDPESKRMSQPQTGGYIQGHRILRATDANSGLILDTCVATEVGESRGLPGIIKRVMLRLGMPSLMRVVVDKGFAGEPNLKALDQLKVHETLIPQQKTSKRGERVKEAKRLVCRRTYWMKKRKRIESGFGHTKENKGLRRLLLRGVRGAEIEMILDAIGFNLEKIAVKFKNISKQKIKQSLALAGQLGF
jgi:transposase